MTLRDRIRRALRSECHCNLLRHYTPRSARQPGSLRWCAEKLGVSASHLVRVRDGERPNVNRLLERYHQLKGK